MKSLKNRLTLFLLAVFFPMLIFSEVLFTISIAKKADLMQKQVEAKTRELGRLREMKPYPGPENLVAVRDHLNLLSTHLETLERKLTRGVIPLKELQKRFSAPQDLYFDLFKFVETYRHRAQEAGILLEDGENFAFGSLLSNKTKTEFPLVSAGEVYRQRLIFGQLLDVLFASQPTRLVSVHREPVTPADAIGGDRYQYPLVGEDFFNLKPPLSSLAPGAANGFGMRLAFTGRTENLRRFLNGVYTSGFPIHVRGLEVIPLSESIYQGAPGRHLANVSTSFDIFDLGVGDLPGEAGRTVPIIEANTSQFTVILEYVGRL